MTSSVYARRAAKDRFEVITPGRTYYLREVN